MMNNAVFSSSKWQDVLNSAYGFLIANDGFEIPVYEVRSIFGKRKWVAVPFGDYAVHPEVTPPEDILNELGELAFKKGVRNIEWRGGNISGYECKQDLREMSVGKYEE